MATLPGMNADVYFGAVDKPLPPLKDLRGQPQPDDEDDDEEPTPLERAGLVAILGFDLQAYAARLAAEAEAASEEDAMLLPPTGRAKAVRKGWNFV